MLSKLKTECGYQFTSKLEGMFTDMRISRGVNDEFQTALQQMRGGASKSNSIDFEVNVLTAGFWPSSSTSNVKLPNIVARSCVAPFADYYLSKNSGRKLSWQYHLGKKVM